jgi:hypothetical protein
VAKETISPEAANSAARARSPDMVVSGTLKAVSALKVAYFPEGLPTGMRGKMMGPTSPSRALVEWSLARLLRSGLTNPFIVHSPPWLTPGR